MRKAVGDKTGEKKLAAVFAEAKDRYAAWGVDAEKALETLRAVPLSIQCWQGDDIAGFEKTGARDSGGIQATGNYPGRARTAAELRSDLSAALALIPGSHRVSLHAMYAETDGTVGRDALEPKHFASWIDWCREKDLGLDFNSTFFAHPLADSGFTLSSADPAIRDYWISHGRASRRIAAAMGQACKGPAIHNIWIPDGMKDIPADRTGPRERLRASLDAVLSERLDPELVRDSVEGKLFGLGSESYVVGSHDFYLGYAIKNRLMLTLDTGHFHPTESVADKISSVLGFVEGVLLHVSRGVRWDSDHVPVLGDDLLALMQEVVRGDYLDRVRVGLDFFDASVNRVAAWVLGARATLKALLSALLEPTAILREREAAGDFTARLALMEEFKTLPLGAIWDYYCLSAGVPVGPAWLDEVRAYEKNVLAKRG